MNADVVAAIGEEEIRFALQFATVAVIALAGFVVRRTIAHVDTMEQRLNRLEHFAARELGYTID